jgi:lipopolysaccharide/colanic/teichoic acid biosynthesis glycosyltransferase
MTTVGDRPRGDHFRRVLDVMLAGTTIVLLSPVIALVAGLLRWRLGSPVLFRQRRVGLHGVEFVILKFRTMQPPSRHGQPDSERLTTFGSFLRRTSLDELPQLVNILRADMSVVGPRPTLPDQVRRYGTRERGRLAVRPGLTGWAQVLGRNALSWPDRITLDLWYIEHRGWRLDTRIVLLSFARLIRPRDVSGPGGVNLGFPVAAAEEKGVSRSPD